MRAAIRTHFITHPSNYHPFAASRAWPKARFRRSAINTSAPLVRRIREVNQPSGSPAMAAIVRAYHRNCHQGGHHPPSAGTAQRVDRHTSVGLCTPNVRKCQSTERICSTDVQGTRAAGFGQR